MKLCRSLAMMQLSLYKLVQYRELANLAIIAKLASLINNLDSLKCYPRASFKASITRDTSVSVSEEPLGRHSPLSNNSRSSPSP